MQNNLTFANFLKEITSQIYSRNIRSGVISICNEIPCLMDLHYYSDLLMRFSFSALWEEKDNMSFIALDKCKYINLDGPNRFKMAKDFYKENKKNLINLDQNSHPSSLTKILYLFSFSDNFHRSSNSMDVSNMEAILPKFLIIKNENKTWIRMNAQFNNRVLVRKILEEFWNFQGEIMSHKICEDKNIINIPISKFDNEFNKLRNNLTKNINKGIQLVDEGILQKIVLSSRMKIKLDSKFYLQQILKKLVNSNKNSCIYVWKRDGTDITFGASPEKLFSLKNNHLILEAVAGTTGSAINNNFLLSNKKNIREHKFVVNFLIKCLKELNINKFDMSDISVKNFGNLSHLKTFLNASVENICPFQVLNTLHPSPAVCGIPKDIANEWIQTLENFSRGNYAAPIGWIDIEGNADFRVAIRGARFIDEQIQLTAGAGLVKDSICFEEVEEIKLKFESIAKQIFVSNIFQ